MKLRLKDLDLIVKNELSLPSVTEAFKAEVRKVFGPSIVVEGRGINEISKDVNNIVEVMIKQGREVPVFDHNVLRSLVTHSHPEVRRTVANLGQQGSLQKLMFDKDQYVRLSVGKRVSTTQLSEMVRKFPKDDELGVLYVQKVLNEAAPKKKEKTYADLSDEWYKSKAYNIVIDYGRNHVDTGWIWPAVRAFCNHQSSFNIHLDPEKLGEAIVEVLTDFNKDKPALTFNQSRAKNVNFDPQPALHTMNESAAPIRHDIIREFTRIYKVVDDVLDISELNCLSESYDILSTIKVPVVCATPGKRPVNEVDERNLDKFVSAFNTKFEIQSIPLKIDWAPSIDQNGVVGFFLKGKF